VRERERERERERDSTGKKTDGLKQAWKDTEE
jgi:hypothetical protein